MLETHHRRQQERQHFRRSLNSAHYLVAASGVAVLLGGLPAAHMEASLSTPEQEAAASAYPAPAESPAGKLQTLVANIQALLQDVIKHIMVLVAKAVDGVSALLSHLQQTLQASTAPRILPAIAEVETSAAPKVEDVKTAEAEIVQEQQGFYNKYGYLIIAGSILGAAIGVLLSRRALETEAAKIVAQRTEEAVRSTSPGHPRRASVGGPLQSSNEHASLVREVLEVLSASSLVTEVLGTAPFKEGRLQAMKGKGAAAASAMLATVPIKGTKSHCSVSIQARRGKGGIECETLVLSLANGETLEVPIVSNASPAQ